METLTVSINALCAQPLTLKQHPPVGNVLVRANDDQLVDLPVDGNAKEVTITTQGSSGHRRHQG